MFVMFFPLLESRGYCISFVACRAEALAKAGQGFAVDYYSLTSAELSRSPPLTPPAVRDFAIGLI
jgi:hypothetical protein